MTKIDYLFLLGYFLVLGGAYVILLTLKKYKTELIKNIFLFSDIEKYNLITTDGLKVDKIKNKTQKKKISEYKEILFYIHRALFLLNGLAYNDINIKVWNDEKTETLFFIDSKEKKLYVVISKEIQKELESGVLSLDAILKWWMNYYDTILNKM